MAQQLFEICLSIKYAVRQLARDGRGGALEAPGLPTLIACPLFLLFLQSTLKSFTFIGKFVCLLVCYFHLSAVVFLEEATFESNSNICPISTGVVLLYYCASQC